jgi:hypothetical protein
MPVTSVTESQTVDASGQLTDVYEITYTIEGRPGSFTVQVAKTAQAVAEARDAIAELQAQVNAIYGL